MSREPFETFDIDIEEYKLTTTEFIGNSCAVRARIRIFVDGLCLTDPDGKYHVSDYLPYNLTKMLRGIEPLLNGETHLVRYTDTVCDLFFRPNGDIILVNAYDADGIPRNPDIPLEGIPVERGVVINGIIEKGEDVKNRYDELNEAKSDEHYQDLINALVNARQAVADANVQ